MMKMEVQRRHATAGFTLLEMLLVVTIIAILAALLLPAVRRAIINAEIARAQVTSKQLATAFLQYQSESGLWPTNATGTLTVDDKLVLSLIGTNMSRTVFLEIELKSWKNDGTGYLDPWGRAFQCRFDQTYRDGIVTPDDSRTVPQGVLVWSTGPLGNGVYAKSW